MSDVTLNTASGSITLTPTNSSGNTVLTLPATSGTVLTTASTDTANNLNAGLGVNQTWQAVTGSRALATTYYNTTGKPILISISSTGNGGFIQGILTVVVGGVNIGAQGANSGTAGGTSNPQISTIVPIGMSYSAAVTAGALFNWAELR